MGQSQCPTEAAAVVIHDTPVRGPERRKAIAFTAASLILTLGWVRLPPIPYFPVWGLGIWSLCCGMIVLSVSRFSSRPSIPVPELWLFAFPFLFGVFFEFFSSAKVASRDLLLWCFDANFGSVAIPLGKLLALCPALNLFCKIAYVSQPLLFVIVYLALPEHVRRTYSAAIALVGIMILPLYALCPGAGPAYLFPSQYPWSTPVSVQPQLVFLPGTALNTTPSGHLAWTLLLFWFTQRYCHKWIVTVFGLNVVITILNTLGLGEHYVIDLILALPFTAAIWAVAVNRDWRRAAINIALLLVWMVALREGWTLKLPPVAVWLLTGATVPFGLLQFFGDAVPGASCTVPAFRP